MVQSLPLIHKLIYFVVIIDLKCYSPKASLFSYDVRSNDLYHKMQEAGWQSFKETGANYCEVVVD